MAGIPGLAGAIKDLTQFQGEMMKELRLITKAVQELVEIAKAEQK